jgi:hypothetical protein
MSACLLPDLKLNKDVAQVSLIKNGNNKLGELLLSLGQVNRMDKYVLRRWW